MLGQALLESLSDGLAVFDLEGRLVYANEHAKRLAAKDAGAGEQGGGDRLRLRLLALGGRATPLRLGSTTLGEAVLVPVDQVRTLAERERQAIVHTLQLASGRLAETARRLGISRTTLWRRLRTYGLGPGNNGRVTTPRPS